MTEIKRWVVDSTLEKRIVIGLIVSTQFLKEISPLLNINYFRNTYLKTITQWCITYFSEYEKAPDSNIQNIYNSYSEKLKPEELELIGSVLDEVSKTYEQAENLNVDYLIDQTTQYFKRREIEMTIGNAQVLLDTNKLSEAEEQILGYRKIARITANWVSPFDSIEIEKVFEEKDKVFFKLPGEIGEFIGALERGFLVGVSGAFKKGKTWLLNEFGILGVLSHLKVAIFNFEMPKKKSLERLYMRMVGLGREEQALYPIFDCRSNQSGECVRPEKPQQPPILDDDGNPPVYSEQINHMVCTHCRGTEHYTKAVWYKTVKTPLFNYDTSVGVLTALAKEYSPYLRVKFYPRFSANLSDINRDLDILEMTEGFIPDIIITDYLDILKPEREGVGGIEKEDESWMAHAKLASERHCLVITGTQINKEGQDTPLTRMKHTAKWVGKMAHVDMMIALNQTEVEKRAGILRLNILVHRHEEFFEEATVTLLQNIKIGQVHLDSQR